jgi:hypothetical protein
MIKSRELNATVGFLHHQWEKSLILLVANYMEQAGDASGILTAPLILNCINTEEKPVSSCWCRDMSQTPHHTA